MIYCVMCQRNFFSLNIFKVHLPSHGGSRLICECGRSFHELRIFIRHLRKSHDIQEQLPVPVEKSSLVDSSLLSSQIPCNDPPCSDGQTSESFAKDMTVQNFQECYDRSVEMLISKLYENPIIPRNFVQTLINDFDVFLNGGFLEILHQKVLTVLSDMQAPQSSVSEISGIFNILTNPFEGLETDYKRMKFFKANKYYIPPEEYEICASRPKSYNSSGGPIIKNVRTTGQFVPFRKVLRNLFELPGALKATLDYVDSLISKSNSGVISNVIQGALWKKKRSNFPDDVIVFPLDFYFDDVETDSAIGPHSDKLGVGCVLIPVLPPTCRSKLENILLALLINSDDRKSIVPGKASYNYEVFKPVIEEFNYLARKGILCSTPDVGEKRLYFLLNRVMGDNLGLHGVLGFAECFTANFPCILCRAPKELVRTITREDLTLLRDPVNYAADVVHNNVTDTGIKEMCAFNKVKLFHVVDNATVDFMHDGPEGAAHYILIPVLGHCISSKFFSLSELNSRLYSFDYGPVDSSNKPVIIPDDFQRRHKLKGTAREILSLVRLLGVIIGDLVPEGDQFWRLYIIHKELTEIAMAKNLPYSLIETYPVLVEEHHQLYIRCVGRDLPPKLHFWLHYARSMLLSGPPSHFSSFRGEAKHRDITKYAKAISSRKNLILSCAQKHQLSMCFRFVSQCPLMPAMICGPGEEIEETDLMYYNQIKSELLPCMSRVQRVNWVNVHGTQCKPRMVLIYGVSNDSCRFKFGKIVDIFVYDAKANFVCQKLYNVGYDNQVGGYQISYSDRYVSVPLDHLLDPFPLYDFPMMSGSRYIVLKHYV